MMLVAGVAELVDALDLGSSVARCGGSSPSARTIALNENHVYRRVRGVERNPRSRVRGRSGPGGVVVAEVNALAEQTSNASAEVG